MIRILLVDDQKSIRERLKSLLETEPDFDIVGMVDNGYDAIEQVKLLLPDVVLMDMEMPDIDGILATKIIAHSSIKTKVLVLSSYDSDEYVARSIYSGANGYILKGAPAEEIRDAIRFVNRGYMQIAPGLFEKFIPAAQSRESLSKSGGKPFKSPPRGNFPPGLELTGLNLVKSPDTNIVSGADFDRPSELILDVTAQTSQKSVGWYQAAALVLAGLGLTSSLYFLRQGLHKPNVPPSQQQKSGRLHELPFNGKILPLKPVVVNATTPGFISEIHVKIGQSVKSGDRLLTIRNVDAERVNQAKIEQQQQLAAQQQQAAQEQASQKQQQVAGQQQILLSEQQAAALRVSSLQISIAHHQRNLAPLREQLATANVQLTATNQSPSASIDQKRATIDRAQAIYDRTLATYQRLAQYQAEGAIPQERVEQAEKEMTVAQADLKIAHAEYNSMIAANAAIGTKQTAQNKAARLQQELILQEQAGQIQQLQTQLRLAQSDYQAISQRLQQLQQQKFLPTVAKSSIVQKFTLEPTKINIFAPINGTVLELPMAMGSQIFTGNKLLSIADLHQLKLGVEIASAEAKLLKSGQRAIIKIGAGIESQEVIGLVTNIIPNDLTEPLVKNNNRSTQNIEIEFTNPKLTALVGQIGTVYFPEY